MFSSNDSDNLKQDSGNLFVPFLGQSNARYMSVIYDSYASDINVSGAMVLDQMLASLIDENVVTSDTLETNFAVGGSKIFSSEYFQDENKVWWHPEANLPGGALIQAVAGLNDWLSDRQAQVTDEIAIIWSQGEADALSHLNQDNPLDRNEFKQSTLAVFDYLQANLDYPNVTFYLVPTGRFQEEAALNRQWSGERINLVQQGREIVREVQEEIALARDDIQLTTDYQDLNTVYEEGLIYGDSYDHSYDYWSKDVWHLGHDGLKVNGDRLAQYIALDRGESNVISFTDSVGNPADSIALSRAGLLDINIAENSLTETIKGTNLPDLLVGTLDADRLIAGAGDDVMIPSLGHDLIITGTGDDVVFYDDTDVHYDYILDFELNRDRLDISELLTSVENQAIDLVNDDYISVTPLATDSLKIQFDSDGMGANSARTLAILKNIDPLAFQQDLADQFVTTPTEY